MKRSNGEGSIYRRSSDNRWCASLMVDGKRRTVYGRTRSEVASKLRQLQEQAHLGGMLSDPGKRTVADLLNAWLEMATPSLKPRTLETYRQLCRVHILPAVGHLRLSHLTPVVIQRLILPLQKAGKTRTAQKVYRVLHRACVLAVLWGWLPTNPCDRMVKPKHTYAQRALWTQDELRRFLDGAKSHPLYPLYLLLIASGLRLGEALALRWGDLDVVTRQLRVSRNVQRVGSEWVFSAPKTPSGVRTITLPDEVVAILRQHRVRQVEQLGAGWRPDELMFANHQGDPLNPSVVGRTLKRLCQHIGVTVVTPHSLRHLHASLLISAGLPITDVSRQLGHANANITLGVYAHYVDRVAGKDAAATAIAEALQVGR
ncbi:MAG: hypothetical protein DDG58_11155 [Ardenticatenia bacterium]|jgi:integrase|nr:MAG: hypothetical protein DDG58_11155 [Ardenticatenia bacterium]